MADSQYCDFQHKACSIVVGLLIVAFGVPGIAASLVSHPQSQAGASIEAIPARPAYSPPSTNSSISSRDAATTPSSLSVVATVDVGSYPLYAAYDGGNGFIYVPNTLSGNVSVINGTAIVASIPTGTEPFWATYDSGNGYVYVSNSESDTVSVISGTSVISTISVGPEPSAIVYDSGNGDLYVVNYAYAGSVSVISGTSLVDTISIGSFTTFLVYDSGNGDVYVTSGDFYGTVTVIGGTSILATIPVGMGTLSAVFDSGNGYVYVPNSDSDNVSVISGTSVVASVPTGSWPTFPTYDTGNGYVYVPNTGSNNVSVIGGTSLVATVPVGTGPNSAAYDGGDGYVFVPNQSVYSPNITVISGVSAIASVPDAADPSLPVYDADNGYVYVANHAYSGSVTVIGGTAGAGPIITSFLASPVALSASGAPAGSPFEPSNYLGGFCGTASGQSVAGCAELSWSIQSAVTCSISTNDPMSSLGGGAVSCNGGPLEVPIPPDSGGSPVAYQFTMKAVSSSGATAESGPITVYALPTVITSSGYAGSSLGVLNQQLNPVSCDHPINQLGCWAEFGACSNPAESTSCVPAIAERDGLPVAGAVGYGFSVGADTDLATASYPSSDLVGLPAGYTVEYYTMADTWTAHFEACGAFEGGAGSTYLVTVQDSSGNSFESPYDVATCLNLEAGELGNEVVQAYQTLTGTEPISVPDLSSVESAAASFVTGLVNTESTDCQVGSNLCQQFNDLASDAGAEGSYFGEEWSAAAGPECGYSVTTGPSAIEASAGFLVGSGQIAESIVEDAVSGVAAPSTSPSACSNDLSTPGIIDLTAPSVPAGSESLIEGLLLNTAGASLPDSSLQMTVNEGSFASTGTSSVQVSTSQTGQFSAVYLAPTLGGSTVTVTATDASVSQQASFIVVPSAYAETSSMGSARLSISPGNIELIVTGATPDALIAAAGEMIGTPGPGFPSASLSNPMYFDVALVNSSSGEAVVCFPNSGAGSGLAMVYLSGQNWMGSTNVSTNETSVCGTVPISALGGTVWAVGTQPAPVGGPGHVVEFLLNSWGGWIIIGLGVMLTIISLIFVRRRRQRNNLSKGEE